VVRILEDFAPHTIWGGSTKLGQYSPIGSRHQIGTLIFLKLIVRLSELTLDLIANETEASNLQLIPK
jgi:hypothetical protein